MANIGQLLTLRSASGKLGPRRDPNFGELGIIENAAVLCLGGKIVSVGTTKDALRDSWLKQSRKKVIEIDCAGKVVLPGFVDSHTHPVFVGPRLVDFEKRIEGASYEEIAAAGGGIRSSLDGVRKAGKRLLAEKVLTVLRDMAAHGTTTVEAKSGYGLTVESELKSLEAIREAASRWPGTVISTLLGAHVVPKEFQGRREKYVEVVCKQMIPKAAKRKLAQFVDVFCDQGAFTAEETKQIFEAAANSSGLERCRAHVGPALRRLPCSRSCVSIRHRSITWITFTKTTSRSWPGMTRSPRFAVPGANYALLGLKEYPRARRLIDAGVPVALATDYNPGHVA